MKKINLFIIILCVSFVNISCSDTYKNPDWIWDKEEIEGPDNEINPDDQFIIEKGINVASWLSTPKYSGEQRKAFFTEVNVKQLSDLGFDHIRLAVDEEVLFDNQGNKIREYAFDLLHDAITWCKKYDMKIIVDLHKTRSHSFTNTENELFTNNEEPAKFVALWKELASELKDYPTSLLAYEILNEPVSADPNNWNRVIGLVIPALRDSEADRTIIVGVCANSTFTPMYNSLKLPSTRGILMTFHSYAPYLLTAYGLDVTNWRTDIPIQYPGQLVPNEYINELPENWRGTGKQTFNKEVLRSFVLPGIKRAKELNVPVFLGEYGTLYTVPEASRANWYRDMVDLLNEYKVPYTSWDYKGAGYSVVDDNNNILHQNLIDIMVQ